MLVNTYIFKSDQYIIHFCVNFFVISVACTETFLFYALSMDLEEKIKGLWTGYQKQHQ